MSFTALMDRLRDLGAQMYVDEGDVLHYAGPPLSPDDPIRLAIAERHDMLAELFTYSPGGRCIADACYRLRVEGSTACSDHQQIEAEVQDRPAGRAQVVGPRPLLTHP
jgi:hypothetical protein